VGACLAERPPGAGTEGFVLVDGERFRRAEARARPADK
jgi:hypothetical protein